MPSMPSVFRVASPLREKSQSGGRLIIFDRSPTALRESALFLR